MPTQRNRVLLVQSAMGGYREKFVDLVRARLGESFTIAAGSGHFEMSLVTAITPDVQLTNHYFLGRRLLHQSGALRAVLRADTVVLELNPRIVNTWSATLLCRALGKRSLVWGHYTGRQLDDTEPRVGRRLLVNLATGIVAYTDEEAGRFRRRWPRKTVFVAPNAVDSRAELPPPESRAGRDTFLYVGRLTPAKDPCLLVRAFAVARAGGLADTPARLVLVGSGPEREAVVALVRELHLGDRVEIAEGTYDTHVLNARYARAVAGVCGGYVGLNITQSLSRGVPFVYVAEAPHAPEISLAISGFNCTAAPTGSAASLASALEEMWTSMSDGHFDLVRIQEDALRRYSVESMSAGFVDAVG